MDSNPRGLARVLERVAPDIARALEERRLVPNGATTPLALSSVALLRGPTVAIVASSSDAEAITQAARALFDESSEVALWPAWDTHPLERVSPEVTTMAARARLRWLLHEGRGPRLIVTSVRGVAQLVAPHAPVPLVRLERGQSVARDVVVAALIERGYRRETLVEHRGEMAVRGGIVDVWDPDEEFPVRVDFFGDEIERLAYFDVGTQRSVLEVVGVEIAPAREWLPDAATRERADELARHASFGRDVFDRIAQGHLFDALEGWMPLFCETPRTLLDEAANYRVVVVDPASCRSRLDDLLSEERELTDVVATTWGADRTIPLLHVPATQVFRDSDLAMDGAFADDVVVSSPPPVQGDPSRLATHVTASGRNHLAVVATSHEGSLERVADQLRAEGLDVSTDPEKVLESRVSVVVSSLPLGFRVESSGVTVWSESDITGRRSVHRVARTRTRAVDGFFDDLSVGSYVVHRQHGVAKFAGTTTRAINGLTRDYLILEFKDGRSYWPTEMIDALTPYSGGEHPTLSKMGGADWQRTRARARAEAFIIAQELVDLYRERTVARGFAFSPDTEWQREMEEQFAFPLTPDQAAAVEAVKRDMESERPMDRLIVADVGFGKTEIAVRAAFKAVQDHKQVAVLVPTTLLASQHHQVFTERFAGFPARIELLSRFVDDAHARATLDRLAEGRVDVVIGTHRLLSEQVTFRDLGLLIVDEEQRFGVNHKEAIKARSVGVDVLTLSASPIPRTLEMAFSGLRDLSMVQTPPVDRRPILTHVGEYDEAAVIEAVRRELLREGQVFYVHNRVSDIDEVARRLTHLVPDARVAIAHGQMDEGTLERVMIDFWERRFDVLVCTTIVENGIDLPSVNTLIVDRAERLGLGQLHQLRGRVGRSGQRAYAYLFHAPAQVLSETAYERLRTIGDNTALGSGFKIAMRDLEIRGAGTFLGHEQSGTSMAAVGFDLYIQLVAEAVRDASGEPEVEPVELVLDIPGDAHLPVSYVEADDARLEAYRRLAALRSLEDLDDLEAEWKDRYGSPPAPARTLLDLARLRVRCLELGVHSLSVSPARPGVRTTPLIRVAPLTLSVSQQIRLRRLHSSKSYDETAREVRVESASLTSAPALLAWLNELVAS